MDSEAQVHESIQIDAQKLPFGICIFLAQKPGHDAGGNGRKAPYHRPGIQRSGTGHLLFFNSWRHFSAADGLGR